MNSSPQTINGLMRHLRNKNNINISGSKEKHQLKTYGYYHGYKGYRFFRTVNNQLSYSSFSEVAAVIEYDNNIKALLYPYLMFVETAVKNIVCNDSIIDLKYSTFEHLYTERMKDNLNRADLQLKRLKLRNTVYSRLSERYNHEKNQENKMVRHFFDRGEDAPLWVVFEIFYLTDLASFFECLDVPQKELILGNLNLLDSSVDTDRNLLSIILYSIKPLRNAVAHNAVVFDARFKDRAISPILKKWVERETGILNISLYSLIDYIIVLCCLLTHIEGSTVKAKRLLSLYKKENLQLSNSVNTQVFDVIVPPNVQDKITKLEQYLCS